MRARELRQFHYFLTLAQELHFSRAAKQACITQSALSQQISRLEESLGVKLLARDQRQVTLTRSGEVLRDGVQQMFQLLEETTRRTREAGGVDDYRLAIGLVEYANIALLPAALMRQQELYPELKLVRHEMNAAIQIAALQRAQIDVGFGGVTQDLKNMLPADGSVSSHPLLSSGWRLLMREDHPLAQQDCIELKQLCGERLIMQSRELNPSLYDWMRLACRRAGASPHFVYETCQIQTGLQMAQNGVGCMLLAGFVQCFQLPGLRSIPVTGMDPVTMHIFWRTAECRPLVLDFLDVVREEAGTYFSSLSAA